MQPIPEQLGSENERYRRSMDNLNSNLRVAGPGIIEAVFLNNGVPTVSVKMAIREKINIDGQESWEDLPTLVDMPLFILEGGGYLVTMPVKKGDECLVIFGDNCIDAWWQSGGVQNQVDKRRHDLSDGFAIVGFRSQPRKIPNYSADTMQLRNEAGTAYFEIDGSTINIKAGAINIIADGNTVIEGKNFLGHHHGGVQPGGSNTGGVT